MVRDKAEDIRQTGARIVLGGDCGCLMNISGAMEYHQIPVYQQHIAEFIWERTNG
jgi:L-lactate dehydrogenase complex protein LldE